MTQFKSIIRSTIIGFILLLLASLPFSMAEADTLGPNNPGVGSNVTGIGTEAWQNPAEITTPGSPYASVTLSRDYRYTNYLQATDYSFSIPPDAIITGIEVAIDHKSTGSSPSIYDNVVSLVKAGENIGESVLVGNNYASLIAWTKNYFSTAIYGSLNDLWGTTWTPAEINDPRFGVAMAAYRQNLGNNLRDAIVDSIQITVYYSFATATTSVDCGSGTPEVTYGDTTTCKATVGESGFLTPSGTVSWTTSGSGSFDNASCNLVEVSIGIAACEVVYTPSVVGDHLITANYSGDVNYDPASGNETVAVIKKPASVIPDAASKIYGGTDPSLTGTLEGFLTADNVTAVYSRVAGETVLGGPYIITAVLSPIEILGNYEVTYNTASYTIIPKATSVTPDAASKVYGNADPALTGTLEGFLITDGVTATYTRTSGESVPNSPYLISAILSPADVVSNYAITYNTANFTITQRSITVTADPETKIFGGTDPVLSYHYPDNSLVFNDTFTGSLTRNPGEDVGSYAILQGTLALPASYDLTFVGNDLSITKADPLCTVTPYEVIYDGIQHIATGMCKGALGENLAGLNLSGTAHFHVGNYTDPWTFTDTTGNYNDGGGSVNDAITVRPITVVADAKAKHVGQIDPPLTYQVTAGSLLTFDGFSGSLTRQPGEIVGVYAILQGSLSLPAYYKITFVGADFTIERTIYLPIIIT